MILLLLIYFDRDTDVSVIFEYYYRLYVSQIVVSDNNNKKNNIQ